MNMTNKPPREDSKHILNTMKDSCFYVKFYDLSKCINDFNLSLVLSLGFTSIVCAYNFFFFRSIDDIILIGLLILSFLMVTLELIVSLYFINYRFININQSTQEILLSDEKTADYFNHKVDHLSNYDLYLIAKQLELHIDLSRYMPRELN